VHCLAAGGKKATGELTCQEFPSISCHWLGETSRGLATDSPLSIRTFRS